MSLDRYRQALAEVVGRDAVRLTEEGAEVLSSTVPLDVDEIESLMRRDGILDDHPRTLPRDH